jgi:MHS family proline/betaine transporter-like MFS transporter
VVGNGEEERVSVMQEAVPTPRRGLDRAGLRVVLIASLGGALEFYDFIVFGTFAAYISRAFFPASDPLVSLLSTFAVFAVGYLSRPLGGLLFGWRGDRAGRRESFMLSLATMSLATIAMGLLPGYASIGAWASAGFVLLRVVQGFCLGGELPGAITYAVEVVPVRHATLACGVVFGCVSAGVLLATGVSALLHAVLPAELMEGWGWRIAFLIGGALGVVSWQLRRTLEESPSFLRMKARLTAAQVAAPNPIALLFRTETARIVLGISATCVVAVFNGLLFAQIPAYLTRTLSYPPGSVAVALNVASAAMSVSLVAATWVADIVPRRLVYRVGCIVIAAGALPAFQAMAAHSLPLLFLLIGLSACFTHGTFAAILADLFPTPVRFTGVAFTMNIGAVVFSGTAPLIATLLISATGRIDAPSILLVAAALVALIASFWLKGAEGEISRDAEVEHIPLSSAAIITSTPR